MSSNYQHGPSYNLTLVDMVAITPQPSGGYVRPVQRNETIGGAVHEQGLYAILTYNALSIAKYQTLLTQFGIMGSLTAEGTFYLPNHAFVYTLYNGIIKRPEMGTDLTRGVFLKSITFYVVRLEQVA